MREKPLPWTAPVSGCPFVCDAVVVIGDEKVGVVVAARPEPLAINPRTWGTEILPELAPEGDDIVVPKHRYSGFFETDLGALLRTTRSSR